jgi:hypothetical protein
MMLKGKGLSAQRAVLITVSVLCASAFAQWTDLSGNAFLSDITKSVSIGDTAPVFWYKLKVVGGNMVVTDTFRVAVGDFNNGIAYTENWGGVNPYGPVVFGWFGGILGSNLFQNKKAVLHWDTGGVAIGAAHSDQNFKLDVNGYMHVKTDIVLGTSNSQQDNSKWVIHSNQNGSPKGHWFTIAPSTGNGDLAGYDWQNCFTIHHDNGHVVIGAGGEDHAERLWVTDCIGSDTLHCTGRMAIGTTNVDTFKLAVNGTIKARGIVVTNTGWSDFVFKKGYNLKPIAEVEKFIKTKKHLEGIPTAKEVAKNGVSLGDMQAKLLQKVEELTLYIIELKRENLALQDRINRLEN